MGLNDLNFSWALAQTYKFSLQCKWDTAAERLRFAENKTVDIREVRYDLTEVQDPIACSFHCSAALSPHLRTGTGLRESTHSVATGHFPVSTCTSQCPCAPPCSQLGAGGRASCYPSCEERAGTPWDYAGLPRVWCALMCHGGMSQILALQSKGVLACRHTVVPCPRLALQCYLNSVLSGNVVFANDYFARRRVPCSPLHFMVLHFSDNSYPFWSTPPPEGGPNLLLTHVFSWHF